MNVTPTSTTFYVVNCAFAFKAKLLGNNNARRSFAQHVLYNLHVTFAEFCGMVMAAKLVSSLCHHVFGVLAVCSQKQMGRIAACWIIATMAYAFPCWYGANEYQMGNSTGDETLTPYPKFTVAIAAYTLHPFPTAKFVDVERLNETENDVNVEEHLNPFDSGATSRGPTKTAEAFFSPVIIGRSG